MLRVSGLLFISMLLVGGSVAEARLVPSWPHAKLHETSDLIVVAHPIETKTFDEKIELDRGTNFYLQAVATTFKVHDKMKGECGKQIEVIHYRLKVVKKGEIAILEDGPHVISFSKSLEHDFVLYLKKRPDGRYTFVSGVDDPQFSAQEIKPISIDNNID